ncbi:[protein-PII] uridylyltransferase [Legionella pneumophila]|uniref:Bifunctional uridylyltransferase/uridylyl-removing enzyme n=1 Tax=Legionella pneumophila subsp. pascullei TaxID=91890 RepID=A0AAX2IXI3_LEGPN|nr:[protein-PII] uridylyltransferase [Legionella pneumophila]AMP89634.1 bifunctional uridylyltransferase/uridylyl-removing protein [Legionella pneumophila subsp. pascullei]AMP92700.1 bifunctional uridylyltransferase/uridylyl-removing protein [Legionella pneumophila subsp. pascullei]AMP95666.1 bifunctional uridylyltransferase/uridylyl-removing protein [Legionella pneumophila subsp. pascullei]SQG90577.1 Cytosine/adenosine deaminase [Legionella pneumophila subsp. pascullei]VEH07122.1 Cytosine/ade
MKNDNRIIKNTIKQFKEKLCKDFSQKANITSITRKLAVFIDAILIQLFIKNKLHMGDNFCLLALGSYGRRELQLHSDIDLLILHTEKVSNIQLQRAQKFIQDCWDVGLEVSHQITTVSSCANLASQDLSVISTIMDMFLLCGHGALMEELIYQTHTLHMWPSHQYFFAKLQEQQNRYAKYGETAYNLEPNIKNGPGGLRDLQILLSISKRHFKIKKLAEGISYGFITDKEYEELKYCQNFLWRVRFALHMLAGKPEERLSFDYQVKLAQFFGYQDQSHILAIEQFMKDYFKVIKRNRELNEMLLQWFNETIVYHQKQKIVRLDNEFQLSNQFIEVRNNRVFKLNPQSILKLFYWLVKQPDIEGVRASTIRLIRESLFLMGKRFRESKETANIFINIFRTGNDPYDALQRMNRYGVLAHYLDCFATVTGQMQYDLFHAYTVDQHTLFVIRNISRFKKNEYAKQFPLCAKIITTLEKPEILYLGALFHDIAKGRGGDHSELGAIEAQQFTQRHFMDAEDSKLVIWLVRYHLLMSQTAQRKDIYDPKTIEQFCQLLPHARYLDYLYLLTVADICGTNPTLWNAWKDSLLKELYHAAKTRLHKQQELVDEAALISIRKQYATDILISDGISSRVIQDLWSQFKGKYFLHESPEVIARHTKAILSSKQFPVVIIMPHHSQGGTEVFIYMPHKDERFTITTSVLSNHHVTIQEAAIITCDNQFDLDTYIILDENNQAFLNERRAEDIQKSLCEHLANTGRLPAISRRRLSRALTHFNVKTQINFIDDNTNHQTQLFLITNDRPGLLATISRVFLALNIHLHNAKIATAGERVEDMFYISNQTGYPLSHEEKIILREKLILELSKNKY